MVQSWDLLLTGGLVVNGDGSQIADVAIQGEIFAEIGSGLDVQNAKQVLDVTGKYIFPGLIDVHVHPVYLDNIGDCSRIAALGGITTLLHFAYARKGESLLEQVENMLTEGLNTSLLDFGLHGGMFEAERQVPEIPDVMKLGVRTFKFFLTYLKQGWYTDDYQLIKAMDILAQNNGMAMVHAENGGGIDYLEDKFLKHPGASALDFNTSRPAALEEEAVFRSICLAEVVGCPLYIPHVTAARSLRPIRRAQAENMPVYAETCPQYLNLTQDVLQKYGAGAKIGPPIRSSEDQTALWQALADDTIQVVASDHAPKKKDIHGDFIQQSFGSPQLETMLLLTHDGGVNQDRITLERLVQVMSENPAKIFGLYPKKGVISPGADADLVVFDPEEEVEIRTEQQKSHAGYTLYNGKRVRGAPTMSFQRGKKVLSDGEVVCEKGNAEFLSTKITDPQIRHQGLIN